MFALLTLIIIAVISVVKSSLSTDEKLSAAIDALQVELDGLDDGLDAETQAALRHDRDVGMRRFKAKLLGRRKLLHVLSDPMQAR